MNRICRGFWEEQGIYWFYCVLSAVREQVFDKKTYSNRKLYINFLVEVGALRMLLLKIPRFFFQINWEGKIDKRNVGKTGIFIQCAMIRIKINFFSFFLCESLLIPYNLSSTKVAYIINSISSFSFVFYFFYSIFPCSIMHLIWVLIDISTI